MTDCGWWRGMVGTARSMVESPNINDDIRRSSGLALFCATRINIRWYAIPETGKFWMCEWDIVPAAFKSPLQRTIAVAIMNPGTGRSIMQKVTMLVMVYNKPDSATTRVVKRRRCRDTVFLQIFTTIAASILLEVSITEHKVIPSHTCCINVYDGGTCEIRLLYSKKLIMKACWYCSRGSDVPIRHHNENWYVVQQ